MKPAPNEEHGRDRLGEFGLDYFTELTIQYIDSLPEARHVDTEAQSDRNVVWFDYDPDVSPPARGGLSACPAQAGAEAGDDSKLSAGAVEMSVSVYPGSPAVTVGVDTRIPYHAFQANAAWILRTCADFGVGIDLDVEEETGETWMFLFLRVFWAGFNCEVLSAAADDLVQCRRALEARVPIGDGRERS